VVTQGSTCSQGKDKEEGEGKESPGSSFCFQGEKKVQSFRCSELNVFLSNSYSIMGRQLFR